MVVSLLLATSLLAPLSLAQVDDSSDFQEETVLEDSGTLTRTEKQKTRVNRESKTEGSKAADRFRDVQVIKSRYTHEGRPLEVDPD